MSAATISPFFRRLVWAAVALAFGVIVFGAFVRLSNAGLSCPDWPTCYGRATWPVQSHEVDAANAAFPQRAVEVHKAWREQTHRHLAAVLGVLVLALALFATRRRRFGNAVIVLAAILVGVSIPLYMAQQYGMALALAGLAKALLIGFALYWSNADLARAATLTFALIVLQALLGMWTVTWLLKPIVVMGHLLGGMTTFSLLLWMAWRSRPDSAWTGGEVMPIRPWLIAGLYVLAVQIALGGWTSANYAALICGTDFPACLGQWRPPTDFHEAFVLWRGIGADYEGGVLDGPARIAIHITHRLFAVVVFLVLLALVLRLRQGRVLANWGVFLGLLLGVQIALGISNVVYGLPLWVAILHNAGAALLLGTLVALWARITKNPSPTRGREKD